MSNIVTLTGSDTIVIDGRVITGLATDDVATLEFPNELASVKTGKNGNSIYALNEQGQQADFKLRINRGCSDDKFLQQRMSQQIANFAGFVLMNGEFVKQLGDGAANITSDTYIAAGGVFIKNVPAKSNTSGDVDQSVSMYDIKFSRAVRIIT